jgi:hypothetical protein
LKYKTEKVYIKNDPEGECTTNAGIANLFKFKFSPIMDVMKIFMKKERMERFGDGSMITTSPTDKAPIGKVFKQRISSNYCNSDTSEEREMNIKIVNIKQTEI